MKTLESTEMYTDAIHGSVIVEASVRSLGRILLVCVGTFFVGLGVLGIFLPVLPTTCFLLLAASCYAKSSARLHHWIMYNKWFGAYLRNYRAGKGIPQKTRMYTLSLLWLSLAYSGLFVIDTLWIQLILALVGAGVTLHLFSIPTLKRSEVA